MSKSLLSAVFLFFLTLGVIAEESIPKPKRKVAHTTTINKDNTITISPKLEEVEAIRLSAKMGTGMSWMITEIDPDLKEAFKSKLTKVKQKSKAKKNDSKLTIVEYQVFFFKAVKPGKHTVTFTHKRHWDETDKPSRIVKVTFAIEGEVDSSKEDAIEPKKEIDSLEKKKDEKSESKSDEKVEPKIEK